MNFKHHHPPVRMSDFVKLEIRTRGSQLRHPHDEQLPARTHGFERVEGCALHSMGLVVYTPHHPRTVIKFKRGSICQRGNIFSNVFRVVPVRLELYLSIKD